MSQKINILTYNLLSSNLSDPSFIIGSSPDDCNPERRFSKILNHFEELITEQSPIFCLQEISQTWVGYLHSFFSERGYYLISSLYGNKFNDYMGVGIAFPLTHYKLLDCEIFRISDYLHDSDSTDIARPTFLSRFISYFTSFFVREEKTEDIFNMLKYKKNTVVNIRLESRSENTDIFCVSTCHMPCNFKNTKFMVLTAACVGHIANCFSNGKPYVLCGDFNSPPDSAVYKLLTEGDLDDSHPSHPNVKIPLIKQYQALRSVYSFVNGKEPEFTYNSKNKWGEFTSTLDYVFISPEWDVKDVEVVGFDPENKEWCPSFTQPSDHYMVYTELIN